MEVGETFCLDVHERSALGRVVVVTAVTLGAVYLRPCPGRIRPNRGRARHASPSIENGNGFHPRKHRYAGIQLQLRTGFSGDPRKEQVLCVGICAQADKAVGG